MGHHFKIGDIAVVIHSETGNTGRMVRIVQETCESPHGHDLVARSLDDGGLSCIADWVKDNGELEEIALTVMELPMRSNNLRKVARCRGTKSCPEN